MDIIQQKFSNFKQFITSVAPKDNEHAHKLCDTQLEHFLMIIKAMGINLETADKDKLIDNMFNKTGLQRCHFSQDHIDKFS